VIEGEIAEVGVRIEATKISWHSFHQDPPRRFPNRPRA